MVAKGLIKIDEHVQASFKQTTPSLLTLLILPMYVLCYHFNKTYRISGSACMIRSIRKNTCINYIINIIYIYTICLCIYKIGNRYIICMYIFWDSIHVYSDFCLMVCGLICTSTFPFCHWSSEAPHSLRHAAREPFLLWPGDCGHPSSQPKPKRLPVLGSLVFGDFNVDTHQSKCPSHTGEALCTHRLTTSTGGRCWRWSCRKTHEQNGWKDLRKMV